MSDNLELRVFFDDHPINETEYRKTVYGDIITIKITSDGLKDVINIHDMRIKSLLYEHNKIKERIKKALKYIDRMKLALNNYYANKLNIETELEELEYLK